MQLAAFGAGALAAASVVGLKKSVDAASNLEEQINKVSVVFRGSEQIVLDWSKKTATSIGISQRAALEFAGTFGNMLVPMGFARDEAAKMSTQLVNLAADMASFNNADPTEVLEALRAGLAGETEPLRRFGIFLNEARIKQEALNAGLVKGKDDLTAAGKAASIYRIILKDTGDAQGDFARTSDSLANQQRILRAQVENVAARIGAVFLPAVTDAANAVSKWLSDEDNIRMLERWAETLEEGVGAALRGIADWVGEHREGIKRFFTETAEFAGDAAEVIGKVAGAADDVAEAVGGWDEVFKFGAILLGLKKLNGVVGVGGAAGSGLAGAAGTAGMLGTRLAALKKLGVIGIGVDILVNWRTGTTYKFLDWLNQQGPGLAQYLPEWMQDLIPAAGNRPLDAPGRTQRPRSVVGQARPTGSGPNAIYPAGTATSVGGGPGQGTHAAKDWQSGNAIDIFASAGTPVLSPVDGRIVKVSGSDPNGGDRRVGGKVIFGYGVTIAGFGGQTYYLAHLDAVSVKAGDRVRRGQVIGRVATWRSGPAHVHVGVPWGNDPRSIAGAPAGSLGTGLDDRAGNDPRRGGAASTQPSGGYGTGADPDLPDYSSIETSADTSIADAATTRAAKKAGIDPRDLTAARGTAAFISNRLENIASPALRARIRQRVGTLTTLLGDVTEPKEFTRVKRNLAALERDFENAVKLTGATRQVQETARSIASALGNMPDAVRRDLAPKVEKLNRELGNVTSKSQLERIKADLEKINAAIKAAVERMQRDVERGRDAVGRALGRAADKALQVLDAKTEELLRRARIVYQGETLGEGELGPAGRALRDFRAAQAAAERARSRAADLAGAESEEELAAIRARHALEDQQATLEQAAAEEEEAIREALDRERARVRDERSIVRERFQGRYEEIVRGFQQEELTAEQAQQQLLDMLADPAWADDFAGAGALIGAAFARSFDEALAGITAAVRELRAAVQGLADATGVPMPGETAAERALRLRSEALNKRYGLGRYVPAGATVAGGGTRNVTMPGGANVTVVLPPVEARFTIDGREIAQATAQPMADEQARIIGYRHGVG